MAEPEAPSASDARSQLLDSVLPVEWKECMLGFIDQGSCGGTLQPFHGDKDPVRDRGEDGDPPCFWSRFKAQLDVERPMDGASGRGTMWEMTLLLSNRDRGNFYPVSSKDVSEMDDREEDEYRQRARAFMRELSESEEDFQAMVLPVLDSAVKGAGAELHWSHAFNTRFFEERFRNGSHNEWSYAYLAVAERVLVLCIKTIQGEVGECPTYAGGPVHDYRHQLRVYLLERSVKGVERADDVVQGCMDVRESNAKDNRLVWSTFDVSHAPGKRGREMRHAKDQTHHNLFDSLTTSLGGGQVCPAKGAYVNDFFNDLRERVHDGYVEAVSKGL